HLPRAMIIPLLNTSAFLKNRDLDGARASGREAVDLALQVGARDLLLSAAVNLVLTCWVAGDWDEAESLHARFRDDFPDNAVDLVSIRAVLAIMRAERDEPIDFELVLPDIDGTDDAGQYVAAIAEALITERDGDPEAAVPAFVRAVDSAHRAFGIDDDFAVVWPIAIERALAAGQASDVDRLLAYIVE